MVAAGTKLVGDLTLTDSLHLDGHVQGTIRSEADLTIGESGRLEGDVEAQRVLVSGRMDGTVVADRLEIVAGGRVTGEVHVADLVIESGGQFNGSSNIRSKDSPRQLGQSRPVLEGTGERARSEDSTAPGEAAGAERKTA